MTKRRKNNKQSRFTKYIKTIFIYSITAVLGFLSAGYKKDYHTHIDCLDDSCVSTFKMKYNAVIHGREKKVDINLYVGTKHQVHEDSEVYNEFVFGYTPNEVVGLTRLSSDSLTYVNIRNYDNKPLFSREKTLLYFDKTPGYKWKVNIDSSYLWRREITFVGKEDGLLVYNIEADAHVTDIDDRVTKIYYKPKEGIVKFIIQTHWFPVTINKVKQ
ncbi:MAG: hypothetical protein DI598_10620 [Pseudopedobacter saltans]|uniref:Uncharacterized protein n=1 Tax=Pseudopedobacter saltans TaxID=151895 RepID=A0A2W5EX89_9SPHI|nr:MAG: hypothetical protein DI598_10620 [Pseudopedobacter saltans]